MNELSLLVLDLFGQDDHQALQRLSKIADNDQKVACMGQVIRGVRHLEELCGQNHIEYKLTEAQRKSYAALVGFVGVQHVIFFCSEFPVLNDRKLVSNALKMMSKPDASMVRIQAIQAVKARQIEMSHILIDWLLKTIPERMNYQEMYLIYEASIFDGKSDPWIFDKIEEFGMVPVILKRASTGRIDIVEEFLNDVKAMNKGLIEKMLREYSQVRR